MNLNFEESDKRLLPHEVTIGSLDYDADAESESLWRDAPFLDVIPLDYFPEPEPERSFMLNLFVKFFYSVPVQITLLLMLFFLIGISISELVAAECKLMVLQMVIFTVFIVERIALLLIEGRSHFHHLYRRYGLLEVVFLFIALLFQLIVILCIDKGRSGVLFCKVLSLLPLLDGRIRRFLLALRRFVSADRRRYKKGDFDLDVVFAHSTVGMMSWPARNFEYIFRNPASEVKRLLDKKYGPHFYRVYNLCSERCYGSMLFDGNVAEYPMDDHNPAELRMMLAFVRDAGDFVRKDVTHRAIILHCKGGKGRTGTMACAYLMYTGLQRTAESALQYFARVRTAEGADFQGVQTPSQVRYVQYFKRLMTSAMPPAPLTVPSGKKKIVGLVLENIPSLWCKGGIAKLWFAIIVNPCTERHVVYLSNPSVTFNPYPSLSSTQPQNRGRDTIIPLEESLYYNAQKVVCGNKLTPCYDTFEVCFETKCMSTYCFDGQFSEATCARSDCFVKRLADSAPVTLKTLQLNQIPALDGDVVIKFFYAKNNPDSLDPPLQFWFHTAMEGSEIRMEKMQLDGPHKDVKNRLYPEGFTVSLRMNNE